MISVLCLLSIHYIHKRFAQLHSNEEPWSTYFQDQNYSELANLKLTSLVKLSNENYLINNVKFLYFNSQLLKVDNTESSIYLYKVQFYENSGNSSTIVYINCKDLTKNQVGCMGLKNSNVLFDTKTENDITESCSIINTYGIDILINIKTDISSISTCNISSIKYCKTLIEIHAELLKYSFIKDCSIELIETNNMLFLDGNYDLNTSNFINCSVNGSFFNLGNYLVGLFKIGFINCSWDTFNSSSKCDACIISGSENYYYPSGNMPSIPSNIVMNGSRNYLSFSFNYPNFVHYTYNLKMDLERYRRKGIKIINV